MKLKIIITAFLLYFCVFSYTQTVTSSLSTRNIKYGEPAVLRLEIQGNESDNIVFPLIKDTLSYHLELLNDKRDTLIKSDKTRVYIDSILFSGYETGTFTVPSQKILINSQEYFSPEYKITIEPVSIDTLKTPLHDIRPIITEPKIFRDYLEQYWIYMLMGLVIFIVAIILAILYYLERKQKKSGDYPGVGPDVIAIRKLDKLEKTNYLEKGLSKKYYSEMISILKEYMEVRWKFPATKLLSDDLLDYLEDKNRIDENEKQELMRIFHSADLAKFAKSRPTVVETKIHTKMAKKFIHDTKTEFLNLRGQNEY